MGEIVDIDNIPIELTAEQQELWGTGHRPTVRKQIREERLSKQYTDDEVARLPKAKSFNEVMGE